MPDFIEQIPAANTVLVSPCIITVSGFSFERIFDNFAIISLICNEELVLEIFNE